MFRQTRGVAIGATILIAALGLCVWQDWEWPQPGLLWLTGIFVLAVPLVALVDIARRLMARSARGRVEVRAAPKRVRLLQFPPR